MGKYHSASVWFGFNHVVIIMLLKCCIFNFTFELFIIALWNKNWICTVPLPSVDLLNSLITMFLTFHTVHGVLRAKILKWFAIPFSSGPRFVRTLHNDPSILGGPTWPGSWFHWVRKQCGFQSVCPLMEKDKRPLEASWWERLTEEETGSCSYGWGHAQ